MNKTSEDDLETGSTVSAEIAIIISLPTGILILFLVYLLIEHFRNKTSPRPVRVAAGGGV